MENITIDGIPLTQHTLQKLVKNWSIEDRLTDLSKMYYFKFSFQIIEIMSKQWLECCIMYVILREVRQSDNLVRLVRRINRQYHECCMNMMFKTNNQYQFLILLTIKLITYFIQSNLPSIKIDIQFESQTFIILNWVILGIEISKKVYSLILKKYILHTQDLKNIAKFKNKNKQALLQKLSNRKSSKKKTRTKNARKQKNSNFNTSDSKTEELFFLQKIKETLYVPPVSLPPNSKTPLRRIDHSIQQPISKELQRKLNNRHITTNQISFSFSQQLAESKIELTKYHHDVNISFKPFNLLKRYSKSVLNIEKVSQQVVKEPKLIDEDSETRKKNISVEDWINITQKIKNDKKETLRRVSHKIPNSYQIKKYITPFLQSDQIIQNNNNVEIQNYQNQRQPRQPVQQLKINLKEKKTTYQVLKLSKLKSKNLKEEKLMFENRCKERMQKVSLLWLDNHNC